MNDNILEFTSNTQSIKEESESIKLDIPYGYKATVTIEQKEEFTHNSKSNTIYINNNIHKAESTNIDSLLNDKNRESSYIFKTINKIKEEEHMKLEKVKNLNKEHMEFLLVSFLTVVLSLIGLLIFSIKGLYFIHPSIYLLGLLMGLGWGATALMSIYKHRGGR